MNCGALSHFGCEVCADGGGGPFAMGHDVLQCSAAVMVRVRRPTPSEAMECEALEGDPGLIKKLGPSPSYVWCRHWVPILILQEGLIPMVGGRHRQQRPVRRHRAQGGTLFSPEGDTGWSLRFLHGL